MSKPKRLTDRQRQLIIEVREAFDAWLKVTKYVNRLPLDVYKGMEISDDKLRTVLAMEDENE